MAQRVTVQHFAEMEGKSEDTIYRWIASGRLDGKNGKGRAEKDAGGYGWMIVLPDEYLPAKVK